MPVTLDLREPTVFGVLRQFLPHRVDARRRELLVDLSAFNSFTLVQPEMLGRVAVARPIAAPGAVLAPIAG
jgi:hypothetical protein